jgi:hypothetical protein
MLSWNWINGRLATGGGIQAAADAQTLLAAGVNTIIDCCEQNDQALLSPFAPGIQYLWNPTADDGAKKPPQWFKASLDFALPLLSKPGHRVYCHCSAGVNRGPSTTFAILIALGLTAQDAEAMIRKARPQVGLRYMQDAMAAVKLLGYS